MMEPAEKIAIRYYSTIDYMHVIVLYIKALAGISTENEQVIQEMCCWRQMQMLIGNRKFPFERHRKSLDDMLVRLMNGYGFRVTLTCHRPYVFKNEFLERSNLFEKLSYNQQTILYCGSKFLIKLAEITVSETI
ncbi:hypothetical protein KUTeg_013853 [Tegillarca granosa]|uniref:Uncharacterized protein n=1 Tax=Tegillarca granosa TaxID=220873 RepID=A0ABQ9EUX2_TEGGR|nr:hypothetical protein KUTeg_013853 [Tegillarca granosa]